MDQNRLKVGVVGTGKMGSLHLQKYLQMDDVQVVGVHDLSEERLEHCEQKLGLKAFRTLSELLFEADAITIASPTSTHFQVAKQALEAGVHVLVEKPVTDNPDSAAILVKLAEKRNLVLQVGLIERFRFRVLSNRIDLNRVRFVESHRLSPTLARESDIDVVSDLMIHDLDLVLSVIQEDPIHVSAVGVPVLTPHYDMANVRLEFPSGAVANLSVSRVSSVQLRKFRVFSTDSYVSMDFVNNNVKLYQRSSTGKIHQHEEAAVQVDPLMIQAEAFIHSIRTGEPPIVTGRDGLRALKCAKEIQKSISQRSHQGSEVPTSGLESFEPLDG